MFPEVWGQELIAVTNSVIEGTDRVHQGASVTELAGEAVGQTGKDDSLSNLGGSNDTCAAWSRDDTEPDRSAFARALLCDGVWLTHLTTPVPLTDWDDVELGVCCRLGYCDCNFLGGTRAIANEALLVAYNNMGTEASALTGRGLLLNRSDLDVAGFDIRNKCINNLYFFDGDRVLEDLEDVGNSTTLYQTAKFGHWFPLF